MTQILALAVSGDNLIPITNATPCRLKLRQTAKTMLLVRLGSFGNLFGLHAPFIKSSVSGVLKAFENLNEQKRFYDKKNRE